MLKILKNKDIFVDIDGTLAEYRFNNHLSAKDGTSNGQTVKEIENHIDNSIANMLYSKINVYYNHYYSSTSFEFVKIQLFPIEFSGSYYDGEDFVTEMDINRVLSSLATFYICYQLRMCESISFAAENMLRSQITSSALDKIEEREIEERQRELKEKKDKSIRKSVENFKKIS